MRGDGGVVVRRSLATDICELYTALFFRLLNSNRLYFFRWWREERVLHSMAHKRAATEMSIGKALTGVGSEFCEKSEWGEVQKSECDFNSASRTLCSRWLWLWFIVAVYRAVVVDSWLCVLGFSLSTMRFKRCDDDEIMVWSLKSRLDCAYSCRIFRRGFDDLQIIIGCMHIGGWHVELNWILLNDGRF